MIFLAFIEENRRLWKGSCDPPKKSYSGWDVSCQGISSKGSLKEDKGTLKNISHRLKGLVMLETSRKEEWWVRFPGCNLGRPQSTESNLVQLKNARSEDRGYTQDTAWCPKSRSWGKPEKILQILLKQNTALLSTVRPSAGVTSQLFSIIWWFRAWTMYFLRACNPGNICSSTQPPGTL